jgi:N-acetylglucosaminyldiphosphoundecaprenol N-acetyl-beta-D-mannosaminyltransferase
MVLNGSWPVLELLCGLPTLRLLDLDFVSAELPTVAALLSKRSGSEPFSYVVTPNADHFVRLRQDPGALMHLYKAAGALHLDSRVVRRVGMLLRMPMPPVVTGSDLTKELFEHHIEPGEPITIVGTTRAAVDCLRARYRLRRLAHHCPPFGFERSQALVEQCTEFVEAHPSRFVFLACGAPRQEILAYRIVERGRANGVGLCVGAAIDQIGGHEARAPTWMRSAGFEWVWRLGREPSRMSRRYWADTKIFFLLIDEARRARASIRQSVPDLDNQQTRAGS